MIIAVVLLMTVWTVNETAPYTAAIHKSTSLTTGIKAPDKTQNETGGTASNQSGLHDCCTTLT